MQPELQSQLKLSLATSKGTYFFNPDEIVRLEARSNYTNIYFTNKTKLNCAKVLKEFAICLEPFGFLRIHRSHLVNRQHIIGLNINNNIVMKDASVAEISKRKKNTVMMALMKNTINETVQDSKWF